MPRELPILFCTEMIEAFLDGRKTQTRRIEGLKVLNTDPDRWNLWATHYNPLEWAFEDLKSHNDSQLKFIKPRYQVGDHLYAKETWAVTRLEGIIPGSLEYPNVLYRADSSTLLILDQPLVWKYCVPKEKMRWRSSRFMPKWAARIWRKVTDVRVERVQDISIIDARAEGIAEYKDGDHEYANRTSIENFAMLWDRLHKKPGERWADNPYVFAYVLKIQERPI